MVARIRRTSYFDRSVLKKRWKQIHEGPIKRAGLLVRGIARRSIRVRKSNKPSPAGDPPRSRASGKPMKLILSIPNRLATRALVGFVGFKKDRRPTPAVHEKGLRVTRNILTKEDTQRRSAKGKFMKKRKVFLRRTLRYAKRPTMAPALKTAAPKLPELWAGSVK